MNARMRTIVEPRRRVARNVASGWAWLAVLEVAANAEKGKHQRWQRHNQWRKHEREAA